MEKIALFVIVFLLIAPIGINQGHSSNTVSDEATLGTGGSTSTFEEYRRDGSENRIDIPTWMIDTTWTYHEDFWVNETPGTGPLKNMTMEKQLTYTVSSIEYVDISGVDTPVYNVTFEGEIPKGEGTFEPEMIDEPVNFTVERGNTTGYILQRMDDLGVVAEFEHMFYELNITDIEGFPPILIDNINNYVHEPVVEYYDFPLTPERQFWANNTINTGGYDEIYVEGEEGDIRNHSYEEVYNRSVEVSEEAFTVEVPSGSYETSLIHETFEVDVTGEEEDSDGEWEEQSWEDGGFRKRYYNREVQNYVKQVYNTREEAPCVDWIRVLEGYEVPDNPNSLSIEPSHAAVGETVTIVGNFPEHEDEDFTLKIPMGDVDISTQADSSGYFSEEFEVPLIEDNTPSPGSFGSVGVIAQMDDAPESVYHVATLSIIEGPIRPLDPVPEDGAKDIDTELDLSVEVDHHEEGSLDVKFYDAADDSLIGSDSVEAGTRAYTSWDELEQGTTYGWYAEADDGEFISKSEVWKFTTFSENTLTINIEGEGSTDPPEGTHPYDEGEEVVVTATPADGWYFEEWTGDHEGTDEEITIIMDEDKEITANFESHFNTLTIDAVGNGSVEVDGMEVDTPYEEEYEHGTEVEIEAVPDDGWYFDIWTGDHEEIDKEITITMDGEKDLTAKFGELLDHLLTIDIEGEGTTVPRRGRHPYNDGEDVTIAATPDQGWFFSNWTGDHPEGEEENKTINITMDDNKTVTAHFGIHRYELIIDIQGEGNTDPEEGVHTYEYGTEIDITAIPEVGWFFNYWSGDTSNITEGAVTNPEIIVTVTGDMELTAHFEEGPFPPVDPYPEDESVDVSVAPRLSVYVEHELEEDIDVTFYDASNDRILGTEENIESGSHAEIIWDGLDHGKVYQWYARSRDGRYTATSETWNFTTTGLHNLTIDVEGEGSTVPSRGTHRYVPGENVSIEAIPDIGWYFSGWTGDHESTEDEINITMDQDKYITANFEEYVTLTVTGDGEGSIEVDGEEKALPYFERYRQGSVITIEAISEDSWYFSGWTGDHEGTEDEINMTMDADKSLQANFEEYFTLEVREITGEGTVDVDGEMIEVPFERKYVRGEEVELQAVPEEGWAFVDWDGIDAEDNETELEMSEDIMVKNVLFKEYFNLEIQEISGEGTVYMDGEMIEVPFERKYIQGEEVELQAVPEEGWTFVEWDGDHPLSAEVITITMDDDKTLQAFFEIIEDDYVLNLNIEGEGSVSISEGTHTFEPGEQVILIAKAEDGWEFTRWTGDHFGIEHEITITMYDDKDITAHFQEMEKEPAHFEIEVTHYNGEVKEGEKVVVHYTVKNTGEVGDTQYIRLKADGETVGIYRGLDLDPNESYNGTLEWETDRAGEYEITLDSADSSIRIGTVTVEEQKILPVPLWSILLILMIVAVALVIMVKKGMILKDEDFKTSLKDFEEEENINDEDAESVDVLNEKISKYEKYLERSESLEEEKELLKSKLRDGEVDQESYDESIRSIRSEKTEVQEKLDELTDEISYEKYERSF